MLSVYLAWIVKKRGVYGRIRQQKAPGKPRGQINFRLTVSPLLDNIEVKFPVLEGFARSCLCLHQYLTGD